MEHVVAQDTLSGLRRSNGAQLPRRRKARQSMPWHLSRCGLPVLVGRDRRARGGYFDCVCFAGIIADPVENGLEFHHRRLQRLIDALEKRWEAEHEDDEFVAHDPYVAHLMDMFDILGNTYRIART